MATNLLIFLLQVARLVATVVIRCFRIQNLAHVQTDITGILSIMTATAAMSLVRLAWMEVCLDALSAAVQMCCYQTQDTAQPHAQLGISPPTKTHAYKKVLFPLNLPLARPLPITRVELWK